ncbi:MAG: hypothetical protein CSB24_01745 [Deltaproteobacteria bacterium]|nr:MAG: hypothetical protein CSB24_01745 [Deltaproteobacteria bacterium]
MQIAGYMFTGQEEEQSRQKLNKYAKEHLGLKVQNFFIEEQAEKSTCFIKRPAGQRMLADLRAGDHLLVLDSASVLGSREQALDLLKNLADRAVSLHCLDLGGNISTADKRKLVVSEGAADLVFKLLQALDSGKVQHDEASPRPKTPAKISIPPGWEAYQDGILIKIMNS